MIFGEWWRVAWACRRYFLSDLLELAGYEPGASSSVAITGIQTDVAQARACSARLLSSHVQALCCAVVCFVLSEACQAEKYLGTGGCLWC